MDSPLWCKWHILYIVALYSVYYIQQFDIIIIIIESNRIYDFVHLKIFLAIIRIVCIKTMTIIIMLMLICAHYVLDDRTKSHSQQFCIRHGIRSDFCKFMYHFTYSWLICFLVSYALNEQEWAREQERWQTVFIICWFWKNSNVNNSTFYGSTTVSYVYVFALFGHGRSAHAINQHTNIYIDVVPLYTSSSTRRMDEPRMMGSQWDKTGNKNQHRPSFSIESFVYLLWKQQMTHKNRGNPSEVESSSTHWFLSNSSINSTNF